MWVIRSFGWVPSRLRKTSNEDGPKPSKIEIIVLFLEGRRMTLITVMNTSHVTPHTSSLKTLSQQTGDCTPQPHLPQGYRRKFWIIWSIDCSTSVPCLWLHHLLTILSIYRREKMPDHGSSAAGRSFLYY